MQPIFQLPRCLTFAGRHPATTVQGASPLPAIGIAVAIVVKVAPQHPPSKAAQLLLPLLGLGLVLGFTSGCHKSPQSDDVRIVVRVEEAQPPRKTPIQNTQRYLGVVKGEAEIDLSFKVGGILDVIGQGPGSDWREGDQVTKGSVLAQLKQADFESAVKSAQAKATLDGSQVERGRRLRTDGALSQQELDVLEAGYKASQAALEQALQAKADSTLTASMNGAVLARLANSGETVLPGRTVLRFADLSTVSVELGVPEKVVSQIREGEEVPISITAMDETRFMGKVSEVGVAAKEGARLYRVKLKVHNPEFRLKSGMTAYATFHELSPVGTNAVLVRLSALVAASPKAGTSENQLAVFVIGADGRAHERWVKTDDIIRSSILVKEGVKAGEKVVVAGASLLYDGALVDARPMETAEGVR